jgi:hypothetical protein
LRYKSALAAVGLLASSLVLTQPAQAAPPTAQQTFDGCSLVIPAKLSIKSDPSSSLGSLGPDCISTIYTAVWKAPAGVDVAQGKLTFARGARNVVFYLTGLPAGRVTFSPVGSATDVKGHKLVDLAPASTVIKCGSVAALTGGRKGTRTALVATVSYWRSSAKHFERWANKKVLLQYQEAGSSTWKGLAYVTTNSNGQASYTYYPGKSRKYRAYAATTSTIWDDFSPIITR